MTPQTENDHPARLLFDFVLREFRSVVQSEIAVVREEIKRIVQSKEILPKVNRFYSLRETAVELNLSEATVRRLIARGLAALEMLYGCSEAQPISSNATPYSPLPGQ